MCLDVHGYAKRPSSTHVGRAQVGLSSNNRGRQAFLPSSGSSRRSHQLTRQTFTVTPVPWLASTTVAIPHSAPNGGR